MQLVYRESLSLHLLSSAHAANIMQKNCYKVDKVGTLVMMSSQKSLWNCIFLYKLVFDNIVDIFTSITNPFQNHNFCLLFVEILVSYKAILNFELDQVLYAAFHNYNAGNIFCPIFYHIMVNYILPFFFACIVARLCKNNFDLNTYWFVLMDFCVCTPSSVMTWNEKKDSKQFFFKLFPHLR